MPVIQRIHRVLVNNGFFYIFLKTGEGEKTDDTGRTFYLWQDAWLRALFDRLGLIVLHSLNSESVLNSRDVWQGYVLRLIE